MTVRPFIKRHMFLISCSVLLLGVLYCTGYVLVNYAAFSDHGNSNFDLQAIDPNHIAFMSLRYAFYALIWLGWKPFVSWILGFYKGTSTNTALGNLLDFRRKLVLYLLLLELLVVQGLWGYLMQWLWRYIHGGG